MGCCCNCINLVVRSATDLYLHVTRVFNEYRAEVYVNDLVRKIAESRMVQDAAGNSYELSAEVQPREAKFMYDLIRERHMTRTLEVCLRIVCLIVHFVFRLGLQMVYLPST